MAQWGYVWEEFTSTHCVAAPTDDRQRKVGGQRQSESEPITTTVKAKLILNRPRSVGLGRQPYVRRRRRRRLPIPKRSTHMCIRYVHTSTHTRHLRLWLADDYTSFSQCTVPVRPTVRVLVCAYVQCCVCMWARTRMAVQHVCVWVCFVVCDGWALACAAERLKIHMWRVHAERLRSLCQCYIVYIQHILEAFSMLQCTNGCLCGNKSHVWACVCEFVWRNE